MKRIGRFHLLTDGRARPGLGHAELARRAMRGGADTIQLREKRPLSARELIAIGDEVRQVVESGEGCALIVDDRVDVARAVGAHGVHLGRTDLPPEVAREILGPEAVLGGTANSYEEALQVAAGPVDYLGVGPVFGTSSKVNPAPDLGLENLARICRDCDKPVIAIGGISEQRIGAVMECGAHGIAVLSAVVLAEDPEAAAGRMRRALDASRGARR